MKWVYILSESWIDDDGCAQKLWTVGFYDPDGKFKTDSDHNDREEAAKRCNYLNGSLNEYLNQKYK